MNYLNLFSLERDIAAVKERKQQQLRQKVQQGDLQGAQMALGGEMALEELERRLAWTVEATERIRSEQEAKQQRREAAKAPQPRTMPSSHRRSA